MNATLKSFYAIFMFCAAVILLSGCGGAGGSSTTPDNGSTDTSAPSVPSGLTAAAASSSSIALNWNASTDNTAVTGYIIYRGGSQVATVANNAYTDTGLAAGATYTYTVAAYDAAGNKSAQSASASSATLAAGQTDTQAPTAPMNLTATAANSSQINLVWTASTDDVAVAGYEIWRGSTKMANVTTTSYSDTGLSASTTYTYTVKAFDGAGNASAASNEASATTETAGGGGGSLRVRVTNWDDGRVANAIVVLGDSDGAMITSGTTDSNGEYTFNNPPSNATVTAAYSCIYTYIYSGGTYTYTRSSMNVTYDVNLPGVTLDVGDCDENALGTVDVVVTDLPAGAAGANVIMGGTSYGTGIVNNQVRQTLMIEPGDLQSDGKLSIAAVAYDENDKPLSYGLLVDQMLISQMTVTISANQAFSNFVQYTLTNIPAGAIGVSGAIDESRKDAIIWLDNGSNDEILTGATATTFSLPYISGFADDFGYMANVNFSLSEYGYPSSSSGIYTWPGPATVPSNRTFDFSQALSVPSNLTVSYPTGTVTPVLSWAGSSTDIDWIYGYVSYPTSTTSCCMYVDITAPPTRTNLIFPQLPDSLSAFRPAGAVRSSTVEFIDYSSSSDYNQYLTYEDQGWPSATSTTSKWSWTNYENPQNQAAKLGKISQTPARSEKWRFGRR